MVSSLAVTVRLPTTHRLSRPRVGAAEEALERADQREGRIVGDRDGVEAEEQLAVALGDDRRDPLRSVSGGVGEADHGVVAAIGAGHHGARRPEVDPQLHGRMLSPARGPRQLQAHPLQGARL